MYFTSLCISVFGIAQLTAAVKLAPLQPLKPQTRAFSQSLIANKVSCQLLAALQDLDPAVNCEPYIYFPTCYGHSTFGHWGFEESKESKSHVNILEMKGVLFTFKIYCKDMHETSVNFKVGSKPPIVWINKQTAHNREILN